MKRSEFFKNVLGLGIGATMFPQLVETLSRSPLFDEEEDDLELPPTQEEKYNMSAISGIHPIHITGCDYFLEWGRGTGPK
jgi:hypothetical protein